MELNPADADYEARGGASEDVGKFRAPRLLEHCCLSSGILLSWAMCCRGPACLKDAVVRFTELLPAA